MRTRLQQAAADAAANESLVPPPQQDEQEAAAAMMIFSDVNSLTVNGMRRCDANYVHFAPSGNVFIRVKRDLKEARQGLINGERCVVESCPNPASAGSNTNHTPRKFSFVVDKTTGASGPMCQVRIGH